MREGSTGKSLVNTFCNHECFIIDMTTGKLNCVSEKDRKNHMKSRGNFRCDGGSCCEGMTPWLCRLWNLTWPCPIVMLKRGCKQSVDSAGMACEGRARNRMLRKRWIVRNPVVGEDDVTQFILARSFNTSSAFVFRWSERLITRQFWSESKKTLSKQGYGCSV